MTFCKGCRRPAHRQAGFLNLAWRLERLGGRFGLKVPFPSTDRCGRNPPIYKGGERNGERASRIGRISWLRDPPPDGWEEKLDQNELIEELKLQALYDAKGAIALGEWCELPTEAIDSIRAWANPPERSAVWDRRNPWCGRA